MAAHATMLRSCSSRVAVRVPAKLFSCRTRLALPVVRVAAPSREDELATMAAEVSRSAKPEAVQALLPAIESTIPAAASKLDLEAAARRQRRKEEQQTYQWAAIAATVGISFLAIAATYLRFESHLEADGEMPWGEVAATLALVAGGVYGMEMWARFAHKVLWHDFQPGWSLHESHHKPRTGPFEANDLYAIMNAVPAMGLCLYGFMTPNMLGGVCFGSGLGITLFGIMYMFVHDGLVHRRFPVGPIAEMPYLKRIAVAHQLHHSGKYDGAPWGMFLAEQELESIPGAVEEVDRMVRDLDFSNRK